MIGYKVLTHDYRSPIRRRAPIWDGTPDVLLPVVRVNTSDLECAAGWNFTRRPETALSIAGLWPCGRPSVLLRVRAEDEVFERGDKCRTSTLRILGQASDSTLRRAVHELSKPFGAHAAQMARDQLAWRRALARPRMDVAAIERGLAQALSARGLDWSLRRYRTAQAARDAWAAWPARDAWIAWDAQDATWPAWDAWAARDARAAWIAWDAQDAQDAWAARIAWDDAQDAWPAWPAWAARDALIVEYASLMGWITADPHVLTVGIRDAYAAGLEVALPVEDGVLGWSA